MECAKNNLPEGNRDIIHAEEGVIYLKTEMQFSLSKRYGDGKKRDYICAH